MAQRLNVSSSDQSSSSIKAKEAKKIECKSGFHLIVNGDWSFCDRNICICDRGMPPNFCDKHLSSQCQKCNRNYHVNSNKQCRRNKCNCENGTPAFYCPKHGYEKCQYCSSGYRKSESGLCKKMKKR